MIVDITLASVTTPTDHVSHLRNFVFDFLLRRSWLWTRHYFLCVYFSRLWIRIQVSLFYLQSNDFYSSEEAVGYSQLNNKINVVLSNESLTNA